MEKYVCSKCGSDNILVKAWIDPKTGIIEDWHDECYCHHCEEVTIYKIINE